jgi:DNA-binding NarL/FixJ family response regulator
MKVLILEDDELMADLLETVVFGLYPDAHVERAERVSVAVASWHEKPADLVIADWNLPDGSGLSLVRTVRQSSLETPVVIISGRSDRESILAAANLGINGYISKPFSVELVHDRLTKLIDPALLEDGAPQSLADRLRLAAETNIQLPGTIDAASVLALSERQDDLTPGQLAERWKREPGLSARLLELANRSSFRRSGNPVQSVKDAITAIGVPMAINQALALALDIAGKLPDPRLKELAQFHQGEAAKVSIEAERLALLLGDRGEVHQTAGLLSRVGELVALKVIQQHLDAGNALSDGDINKAMVDWAQALGNRVKIQWRLSLEIRELVGAVYMLRKDTVAKDRLVMRAAALVAEGAGDAENCQRLLRQLGLSNEERGKDDTD